MSEDSRAPPAQDRPLSFSSDELLRHLDAFTKRFETSQTELATSIRNEVTAAVAPLQTSQREIIDELETTRNKVSEIALDNADTKSKVEILQQQMLSMEQRLSNSNGPAPPKDSIGPPLPPRTPQLKTSGSVGVKHKKLCYQISGPYHSVKDYVLY